jgi:hypothetical protein
MFGGSPNFMPMDSYPQPYPPQGFAAPQTYAPRAYAPQAYAPPQQQWARPTAAQSHPAQTAQANVQPAPRTYRGQESEDVRLQLPSPEQLGLNRPAASAAPAAVDWATVHQRLDRLGATCFHMEKLTRGARVTCVLPTAKADYSHRIEAVADSEAEAVALAVTQAEQWAVGK